MGGMGGYPGGGAGAMGAAAAMGANYPDYYNMMLNPLAVQQVPDRANSVREIRTIFDTF